MQTTDLPWGYIGAVYQNQHKRSLWSTTLCLGVITFWFLNSTTCTAGRSTAGQESSTLCARLGSQSSTSSHSVLICLLPIERGSDGSCGRCTERFSQDAPALLRAFGYKEEEALWSNATRIHSNLRASVDLTRRSSGMMPSKKETSSTVAEDDLYVRRVLNPWDTQLHHYICGDG